MALLVGIRLVDYVSKKTGKPVTGYNFYLCDQEIGVIGQAAYDEYVSVEVADRFLGLFKTLDDAIGSDLRIYHDRFRRVTSIELLD